MEKLFDWSIAHNLTKQRRIGINKSQDNESRPIPCSYVSFAGHYADRVIADVRALKPALIIYETFSVIAPVVAQALDIPYVNVCVNHNPHPARCLKALKQDNRVHISEQCRRAVQHLRCEFNQTDATPFSYVSSLSPLLNIYCEPAEFLDEVDRQAFEPLAFFGCLPDGQGRDRLLWRDTEREKRSSQLQIYVSFGTVVWRYFAAEARAALLAISQACQQLPEIQAKISLGSADADQDLLRSLRSSSVEVSGFVDQNDALRQADLFVTHHGINSTHEAIMHRVPMLSYPFFSDQPALARKCQDLGLALPLTSQPRGPLTVGDVHATIEKYHERKQALLANLQRARQWEFRTIAERDGVMDRLEALMGWNRIVRSLRSA